MPRTLDDLSWPLRTERLVVGRIRPEDAEALFAYRCDPVVAEWAGTVPSDLGTWRERCASDEVRAAVLVPRYDGEVVGELVLAVRDGWAQTEVADRAAGVEAEIGYALAPAYQGRGLATEAAAALLRLAFDDLGLHRVLARTPLANEASWRVMERVGMPRVALHRAAYLHRTRGWIDDVEHAVVAEQWRARRTGGA